MKKTSTYIRVYRPIHMHIYIWHRPTYIHTYRQTDRHTGIQAYIDTQKHIFIVCVCEYTRTQTCNVHTYINTYICTYTHANQCMHVTYNTHIHTYMHTYLHTWFYTLMHPSSAMLSAKRPLDQTSWQLTAMPLCSTTYRNGHTVLDTKNTSNLTILLTKLQDI